ncbi:hypothetical protein RB653_004147 [Dictyostelium firmibasis]|uniref:Uncharacterized protein n=1 Tax=Dictyostelium firmibasis TaxID=79012 RepID=A0AAN7YZS9_9MYCE
MDSLFRIFYVQKKIMANKEEKKTHMVENFEEIIKKILSDNNDSFDTIKNVENRIFNVKVDNENQINKKTSNKNTSSITNEPNSPNNSDPKPNPGDKIPSKSRERNISFINIIKDIIISMSNVYKEIKLEVNTNSSDAVINIKRNFITLSALYAQIFEKTSFYDYESLVEVDLIYWRIFSMKKRLSKVNLSNISIGAPLRNSIQHHNYVHDNDSFQLYSEFLKNYYLSEHTLHEYNNFEKSFKDEKDPKEIKVLIFNLCETKGYSYIDCFREENLLNLCKYFMGYSHCLYAILTRQLKNVPLSREVCNILADRYGIDVDKIIIKTVTSDEILEEIQRKSECFSKSNDIERVSISDLIEKNQLHSI